jgi:hypothetical protein
MNHFNPVGKSRFIYFLNKIQNIFQEAESSGNVGLFVYSSDMRTPLFMLEGLSRLYKKIYKHQINKLKDDFKELEDRLGIIDYYDGFYKQFINEKKIPEAITLFVKEKREENILTFNEYLNKEKWIGKKQKRLSAIFKKLDEVEWQDEKTDTEAILNVYQNEVSKIIKKYKDGRKTFSEIENDVHELRRNLRWLSIYPQALLGLMQLKTNEEPAAFLIKYLTPTIINSPFNKMPDGTALQNHILLHQNYYFALSWVIAELGKLKDSGLKVRLLEEAITAVYKTKENVSVLAYSICEDNQPTILQILSEAQNISDTFFDENILENLVATDRSY